MSLPIIITTRPVDDAKQDIADLKSHGITALAAPMLKIIPTITKAMPETTPDAVVFTSRHAPKQIDQSLYDCPCYCVGASTAVAAYEAGFKSIITGPGDGQGLVALMQKDHLTQVYWPSAVDTGFNIADALTQDQIKVERQAVYKAAVTTSWPDDVANAIQNGVVAAILMHSGRAGEHFTKMINDHELQEAAKTITAIVISSRAAGLCGQGWHNIKVAASPRRSAMFAAAAEVLNMPASIFNDADLDQDL